MSTKIKKFSIFEARFCAQTANPFGAEFCARFTLPNGTSKTVNGFYDGKGEFAVRFMPESEGQYSFVTKSDLPLLNGERGAFVCEGAEGHGKVVADGIYLEHMDGARHNSVGTTCYAWIYQSEKVLNDTLLELSKGYFNKIRMCIFPKWYMLNETQPDIYPFEGTLDNFDYGKPNIEFFKQLDGYIARLNELNIQADIILFHPYDSEEWGFSKMSKKQDLAYIKYVTARLSAYQNVWWSVANEYDIFHDKRNYKHKLKAWKGIVKAVAVNNPFSHLIGIHQCLTMFGHDNKYITHCSLQRKGMYLSAEQTCELQKRYGKPVVWDEIAYEGNIKPTFGNCTAEELTRRFWEAAIRGGYAGHSETYAYPDDILWWSKGGKLHGESHKRIKFLKNIFEEYGNPQLYCFQNEEQLPISAYEDDIFAFYFGNTQSARQDICLPQKYPYEIEVIDTWNMERKVLKGTYSGTSEIELWQRPYIAVFAKKASDKKLLPEKFDADCLLRDLRYYKGGKFIYKILTKTKVLKGNEFVLYSSLRHLQSMAKDIVTDKMIEELVEYANDGRLFKHLLSMAFRRK